MAGRELEERDKDSSEAVKNRVLDLDIKLQIRSIKTVRTKFEITNAKKSINLKQELIEKL